MLYKPSSSVLSSRFTHAKHEDDTDKVEVARDQEVRPWGPCDVLFTFISFISNGDPKFLTSFSYPPFYLYNNSVRNIRNVRLNA